MLDTLAHDEGAERGRAEIPGPAGSRCQGSGTRGHWTVGLSRQSVHAWLCRDRDQSRRVSLTVSAKFVSLRGRSRGCTNELFGSPYGMNEFADPCHQPTDNPLRRLRSGDTPMRRPAEQPARPGGRESDTPMRRPAEQPARPGGRESDTPMRRPAEQPARPGGRESDTPMRRPAEQPARPARPVLARVVWNDWTAEIGAVGMWDADAQTYDTVRPTGRRAAEVRQAFADFLAESIVDAVWPVPSTGMRPPASRAELLTVAEKLLNPRQLAGELVGATVQIAAVHAGIPPFAARLMGQAAKDWFASLSSPDPDAPRCGLCSTRTSRSLPRTGL